MMQKALELQLKSMKLHNINVDRSESKVSPRSHNEEEIVVILMTNKLKYYHHQLFRLGLEVHVL